MAKENLKVGKIDGTTEPCERPITIRHLMTHTADLVMECYFKGLKIMLKRKHLVLNLVIINQKILPIQHLHFNLARNLDIAKQQIYLV